LPGGQEGEQHEAQGRAKNPESHIADYTVAPISYLVQKNQSQRRFLGVHYQRPRGRQRKTAPKRRAILMTTIPALLLQNDAANTAVGGGLLAFGGVMMIVCLVIAVVFLIGLWKVFEKAGQPGWACLIPFYSAYVLLKIAGRPGWWLILLLIPLLNIVIWLLVAIDIAKVFGQSTVFGVVLIFLLGGIGFLVLGFGNYRYVGPVAAAA
jgi:hypothetical protein